MYARKYPAPGLASLVANQGAFAGILPNTSIAVWGQGSNGGENYFGGNTHPWRLLPCFDSARLASLAAQAWR